KGAAREEAYRLVQRNAMKAWRREGDFLSLLKNDPEVTRWIQGSELETCFDLAHHLKHVDTIFARVFGAAAPPARREAPAQRSVRVAGRAGVEAKLAADDTFGIGSGGTGRAASGMALPTVAVGRPGSALRAAPVDRADPSALPKAAAPEPLVPDAAPGW